MSCGRRHLHTLALALIALSVSGCDSPTDPAALGTLCLPQRPGCPDAVSLSRSGVGRNALEVEVATNLSSSADLSLIVSTPSEIGLPSDTPRIEDRWLLASRDYTLGAGERVIERIEPAELTVAPELVLELQSQSAGGIVELNYLLISEPLECIDDNDCARRERCEPVYGRCANCLSDSDCAPTQSCSQQNGRCFPEAQSGCRSASGSSPTTPLMLLTAMGFFVFKRRQRRAGARVLPGAALALALLATAPGEAQAAPGASLSIGGGGRLLLGEFATGASPGWGIALNQEFRWRFAGMSLHFLSGNHATRHDSPPFEAHAQTFALGLGPRGYYPIGPIEAQLGLDYMHVGLAGTGLVQNTGLHRDFHALGGIAAARWSFGDFHLIGRASYHELVDASGRMLGLDVMVGMGF
ncbi:PEP-CTERM sorting domain-containing protein [Lujinxingia sediminis]|uniref:PEP-CTERM sorting domain-containing protein n=1 Tax=Lujinxingia sediminis TaxID=2480984 RepID=A0ABY0CSK8_9DELT|nr:dickkopf-related protein [Lujinxingia sediminis]RVU44083.1 PEP-CTERM sorting domain-containing protein [Lujinxingia sediminis]